MKTKNRLYHRFKALWMSDLTTGDPNHAYDSILDDICLKADLCENFEDYIHSLCTSMIEVLEARTTRSSIVNHPVLFSKLMLLGSDLSKNSYFNSESFYLGLFIDIQIKYDWFKIKFYRLIKSLLRRVLDEGLEISTKLKKKLISLIQEQNVNLYKLYFTNKNLKLSA